MNTDLHTFIREIEAYCKERGIKPESLCSMACNQSRLFGRLQRRADKTASDIAALREYMDAHPVQSRKGAA